MLIPSRPMSRASPRRDGRSRMKREGGIHLVIATEPLKGCCDAVGIRIRDGFLALLRQLVRGCGPQRCGTWIQKLGPMEMSQGNREGPTGAPFPEGAPESVGAGRITSDSNATVGSELGRDRSVIWR